MAPSDWRQRRFADVAEIAKESVSTAVLAGCERVRLYSIPAFDDRREPQEVAGAAIGSNKFEVPQDCVLLSRLNPRIPRVWRVTHDGACRAVSSTEFWPISAVQREVDHDFLAHFLRSSFFLEHPSIRPASTTNSHQRIEQVSVERFTLALPPLAEQRKIAAILSSVDETIEKTEAVIAQLDVVKKAMLEELMTRGIPGRHSRFKQTEIGEVPEGWTVAPLGSCCSRLTDGSHQSVKTTEDGEVPFLFVSCIRDGQLLLHNARRIPKATYANISRGRELEEGDILYTAVGSYGHAVRIRRALEAGFQRHVACLRPIASIVSPLFLEQWMNSPRCRDYADRVAVGNAQKTVTLGKLKEMPVPLPTLAEQIELGSILSVIDDLATSTRVEAVRLAEMKAALSGSLLNGDIRVSASEAS